MAAGLLNGQWIVVTGAARRVGRSIATHLHAGGAGIAIHCHRSVDAASRLADELNAGRDGSAFHIAADLRQPEQCEALIRSVLERAGRIDGLVNNASTFFETPLGSIAPEQFDELVGTNLKAPLFVSQAAAAALRASRGAIVNITDIHAERPLERYSVYSSAKAGLEMLTRSLARELAPDVRVNAVAPGAVLWPEDLDSRELRAKIIGKVPLGRAGEPADIAKAVEFFLARAPYVTGQTLAVDGGRSLGF